MSAPPDSPLRSPAASSSRRLRSAVFRGIAAGALAQGVTTASSLLVLPLVLTGLGVERFAWYVALLAAPTLLGSPDLGIGSGLVSPLSQALASNNSRLARGLVAASVRMLMGAGAVGSVLVVAGSLAYIAVTKPSLGSRAELFSAVLTLAACLLIAVPASIGNRILLASQESWLVSAGTAAASMGGVLLAVFCSVAHLSLPYYVLSYYFPWILAGLLLTAVGHRRLLGAPLNSEWRQYIRPVLRSGSKYSALQLSGALLYQADGLIVLHYLGESEATILNVATRLFGLGPLICTLLLTPLWPALAAKKSTGSIRERDLYIGAVAACITVNGIWVLICLTVGPIAVGFWTRGALQTIPAELSWALAAWTLVNGVNGPTATFLNAADCLRPQLVAAVPMIPCNLALSIGLASQGLIYGPLLGSVVTQLCIGIPLQISGLARSWHNENSRSLS